MVAYSIMKFDRLSILKCKELIETNKEGITLKLNGKKDIKNKGYYVSITNNTFNKVRFNDVYKLMLKAYLYEKNNSINAFIGGWFSAKSKKWYIDISLYFVNRQEALKVAKEYKQEAIFNIKNMQSIFL